MTQKQPPVEKEKKIAGRPEAERPEEDAGKKSSVVTPGRVIASICQCLKSICSVV